MAGYILILAILILGGAIATLGDRLGSRVGKARLRLFNLRPRKTATLVTVLTGSIISLLTLAILFGLSDQLREGVFNLESIQKQRRQAEAELKAAQTEKNAIQDDLAQAKRELTGVQKRLETINRSLKKAIVRQNLTQAQLEKVQGKFQTAQAGLKKFSQQAQVLRSEINRLLADEKQLQAERQRLLVQRNQAQARLQQAEMEQEQLERSVTAAQASLSAVRNQRDELERSIKQTQTQLIQTQAQLKQAAADQQQLEQAVAEAEISLRQAHAQRASLLNQQKKLELEVAALGVNRQRLERSVQALLLGLRRGNIAIRAGQVLASGVIQNTTTSVSARQAIEQLRQEARRAAITLTKPQQLAANQAPVQIVNLDELTRQMDDGQVYAVRLLAAFNYLEQETFRDYGIQVIAQIAPNRVVFPTGQRVATVEVNPTQMSDDQILERLDYLFTVSNRRAVESGILRDPLTGTVGSFRQADLIKFILQLKRYQGRINVAAVSAETIYTSGPLKLELVALQNQEVIFRSR